MILLEPMSQVQLIDYWAPWCGPCKMMAPVLEELKKELGDKLEVLEINVDDHQDEVSQKGIMSIPTYIIMKDGKEVGRKVGVTAKAELLKLINA